MPINKPTRIIRAAKRGGPNLLLERLIEDAFKATCKAEEIAAAGPRGAVYDDLLEAHSALLRARNRRRTDG